MCSEKSIPPGRNILREGKEKEIQIESSFYFKGKNEKLPLGHIAVACCAEHAQSAHCPGVTIQSLVLARENILGDP